MRPGQEPRIKRQEDLLWFKLLDRFGLPTVAFLIMLLFMLRESERQAVRIDQERKDGRIVLQSIADSLNANTRVLQRILDSCRTDPEKGSGMDERARGKGSAMERTP